MNTGEGLYLETSEIGGTKNYVTGDSIGLQSLLYDLDIQEKKEKGRVIDKQSVRKQIQRITMFVKVLTEEVLRPIETNPVMRLKDLEGMLQKAYHPGSIYTLGKYRFATSFNISGTRFERTNDTVIASGGAHTLGKGKDTDVAATTKTNMGTTEYMATDMLGFSSKSASPTGGYKYKEGKHDGYGFMGKVPELRPMSDEQFDKKIYEKIMNTPVEIYFSGYAVEANNQEIAIMPTFTIKGEQIEEFMKRFSHQKSNTTKLDAPTSKMWLSENT